MNKTKALKILKRLKQEVGNPANDNSAWRHSVYESVKKILGNDNTLTKSVYPSSFYGLSHRNIEYINTLADIEVRLNAIIQFVEDHGVVKERTTLWKWIEGMNPQVRWGAIISIMSLVFFMGKLTNKYFDNKTRIYEYQELLRLRIFRDSVARSTPQDTTKKDKPYYEYITDTIKRDSKNK